MRKDLRPWNVRPGDAMRVAVFPFESVDGLPTRWGKVRSVVPDKNFMTGERLWLIFVQLDGAADNDWKRVGGYYRDQRVTVYR